MLRDSTVARRRAYAPTSNTAAHDNHEKISSWVSFSLYGYGAPFGGPLGRRSSAIIFRISTSCALTVSTNQKDVSDAGQEKKSEIQLLGGSVHFSF